MDLQSRKYQLVIMNPKERGYTHDRIKEIISDFKSCVYWCMADEIGTENNTFHTHIYIQFNSAVRTSTIANKFPTIHYEICRGTAYQNKEYVSKTGKWALDAKQETSIEGSFEEYGEIPIERQGQRNDLTDLYDMIKSGLSDYEIISTNQNYMLQLDKIQKVRRILQSERYKHEFRKLQVIYIYGRTGTGKTRSVMEEYGYNDVYRITDYKHPWDGYNSQSVVCFDEFRSSLSIVSMLNYLDGYPLELPCRYENKIACFEKVYILSNISPERQYLEEQKYEAETFKAFWRRIHKIYERTEEGLKEWENIN